MMESKADQVWSKIFGFQIPSHTSSSKSYTVSMTSNGWTCTCMDFKIRKGSYIIKFDDEKLQVCKHIIDYLKILNRDGKHTIKKQIGIGLWEEL